MGLWIDHLLLNLLRGKNYPCNGTLVCKDLECRYSPIEESEKELEALLKMYWRGLSKPLHFFPDSSWAYVESIVKGKTREKALESAKNKWVGNEYIPGEVKDLYYQLCFGKIDPFNMEFENVAMAVFGHLVRLEEKVKA
jgi:exodeoxyribonuclease V gamma subunit